MSEISTFIDNTYSTMVGVLSKYDPEIYSNKIIKEHFVLDIYNKKFLFFYKEENDKVKDTICLYTYIKSCIEDSNFFNIFKSKDNLQDGIKLYESIQNILEKLKSRSDKLTSIDYSLIRNASFFNKYGFETEMQSIEWNKRLQEAFYVFILQIIKNFGIMNYSHTKNNFETDKNNCEIINNYLEIINDFENVSNSRIPSFVKEYDIPVKENQKLSNKNLDAKKAGEIFKEQLLKSSKYYSFAFRNYNPIDLYKIPYTFINEFIYYSQFKHLNEINIFNLIDQFYGKIKLLDFEELSKEKEEKYMELKLNLRKEEEKVNENKKRKIDTENEMKVKCIEEDLRKENKEYQNIYLFSFDNFSYYYKRYLRDIINREQEDDKENFSKVKSTNRLYKGYKRHNYFLSQKILNLYITFTNNNLEDLLKVFELKEYEYKKSDEDEKNISKGASSLNINNNISNNIILKKDSNIKKSLEDSIENKNDVIDYFYLLQNKSKKDKNLKEKLFHTYDMIEIPNIIEKNFIMEKSFSCYELIEYSLLNVIAITRLIESKIINNLNVIKIICDFCDITKLPVKKYMNIYLNIFKTLYQKQNGNIIEKFKIEECFKLIFSYICKENMISEEEKKEFLNELKINSLEISSIPESNDFIDYMKEFGKLFKIFNGLFSPNYTKFENTLKIIESIHFGQYEKNVFNFDYQSLTGLSKLNNLNDKNTKFIPKTPILLYYNTNKLLKKYLIDFSNENILYNELYKDILSLLIYFKIPIIGNKWVENFEEQNPNKNVKINKKEENKIKSYKNNKIGNKISKSSTKAKNESNNSSINENEKWEILENDKKEDKSKSNKNESEIKEISKENKYEVNEILNKIIAILFELISNIKEKL